MVDGVAIMSKLTTCNAGHDSGIFALLSWKFYAVAVRECIVPSLGQFADSLNPVSGIGHFVIMTATEL